MAVGPDFSAKLMVRDGRTMLRVHGEIDISAQDAFRAAIASLRDGPCVIDVAGVSFLDSSGIAVLFEALSSRKSVVLRNPTMPVRRVLEVVGLDQLVAFEFTSD